MHVISPSGTNVRFNTPFRILSIVPEVRVTNLS